MSIYKQCAEAAREILDNPALTSKQHRGLFTELDVIALASRTAGGYTEDALKVAGIEANNVMGSLFRRRECARYGPVDLPDYATQDYVRIATKIAYAHPTDGPAMIETPNGRFRRVMVHDTNLRVGRFKGGNRDDLRPWDKPEGKPHLRIIKEEDLSPEQELRALGQMVAELTSRVEELEAAEARRRQLYAAS